MSTTQIFADLLVAGLQSLAWLWLIARLAFGSNPLAHLPFGSDTINALLLIPIAYPMGILVDNIAQAILRKWGMAIALKAQGETKPEPAGDPEQQAATAPSGVKSRPRVGWLETLWQADWERVASYVDYARTRTSASPAPLS